MGQEQSGLVGDDIPPQTLSERSLEGVAELINKGHAKRIVVMTGAGLSTAAGIPDFRSPKTGLYSNLAKLGLPYPEAVFSLDYFRKKPEPFYILANELYPGNFAPTISHVFIALLAHKGLLRMLFTQNIDCLEREAGVPDELIVEAHGSFATQRCIECGTAFPADEMRRHVEAKTPPRCADAQCRGLVKPDIVFFGEQLPRRFFEASDVPRDDADLVLVMGTSLSVQPFAFLPQNTPHHLPRVLFNLEQVGGIGSRPDDVLVLKDCDAGVRELADALGWRDELERRWRATVGEEQAERQLGTARARERAAEEKEEEVSKLADEVEEALHLTDGEANADDREKKAALTTLQSKEEEEEEERETQEAEEEEGRATTATAAAAAAPSSRPAPTGASGSETSSSPPRVPTDQPPVTWILGLANGEMPGPTTRESKPDALATTAPAVGTAGTSSAATSDGGKGEQDSKL